MNKANKWHSWAQEHDEQSKTRLPSTTSIESCSPKLTPYRSISPFQKPCSQQQQQQQQRKNSFKPTTQQLELITVEPPLCFCKKPAHRSYTLEYGPILECSSYSTNPSIDYNKNNFKNKYTCGFHVHETSWNKFKQDLKNGNKISAEYSELRACPLYNFTYCTMFYITNQFDKEPPTDLPNCFCAKPVKLNYYQSKIYFSCKNVTIEGARKCSWKLEAKEVAFPRPRNRLHNFVDLETYLQHTKPIKQQQHHHDLLLATLIEPSSNTAADIVDFETLNQQSHHYHNHQHHQQSPPPPINLVIPTSVLAAMKQQQPTLSLSSSSSASSTTSSMNNNNDNKIAFELEEARTLNNALRTEMTRSRQDYKTRLQDMELKILSSMQKLTSVQDECQQKIGVLELELEEESSLRLSSQERLSSIELDVINLMNEKEKVTEELANFRESTRTKYGTEEEYNKCKVCFHKTIEYILIPCYHFAYCQLCASKLKECALCRRSISGIQKVYSC